MQRTLLRNAARFAALTARRSASSHAYAVVRDSVGGSSLAVRKIEVPDAASPGRVRVSWLAAGVNAEDLATAAAPDVASGMEGVARVTHVGDGVKVLKEGDLVVPVKPHIGTWCTASEVVASDVLRLPADIRVELAATLSAPLTAMRLLAEAKPGDVVLQNAASGPVGTAVVQIARVMGVSTVSLVAESMTEYAPTVERLKLMGGDVVIGESYATSAGFKAVLDDLPAPKLALNGAQDAAALLALTPKGATVVSYSPHSVAEHKDGVKTDSFSLAEWLDATDAHTVESMLVALTDLMRQEKLTGWLQRVPFEKLPNAVERGTMLRRKLVAIMGEA